jgi:DNA-binding LacI/PurR family transcriptional regulator
VGVELEAAASLAAEHFVQLGHRRIGFVTYRRHPGEISYHRRKRTVGHTDCILALGHRLRELGLHHAMTIYYTPTTGPSTASEMLDRELRESARRWLSGAGRPTAIYGEDHRVAAIAYVARQMGMRVPEDLEVLGLSNTPWSVWLGFPSISLQESLVARKVVELVQKEEGELAGVNVNITIPPRIIFRRPAAEVPLGELRTRLARQG